MVGSVRMWLAGWVLLGGSLGGFAQAQSQAGPPATTDAALAEMAGEAGVIFAGSVLSIDRQDALGYVDVRFTVEQAVLGVRPGGVYAMREWAGLWRGVPPFRLGQRLLVMLRGRSASGLSSPVAGGAGVMPIVGGGAPAVAKVADDAAAGAAQVDLRWVGARVARTSAPVATPVGGPVVRPELVQAPVMQMADASLASGPALSSVVSLLQGAVRDGRR